MTYYKNGALKETLLKIESDVGEIKDDLSKSIDKLTNAVEKLTVQVDTLNINFRDKVEDFIKIIAKMIPLKVVAMMFGILVLALAGIEGVDWFFKQYLK